METGKTSKGLVAVVISDSTIGGLLGPAFGENSISIRKVEYCMNYAENNKSQKIRGYKLNPQQISPKKYSQ